MAVLSKAMYRFNTAPLKLPRAFFTELEQKILTFVCRNIRPLTALEILRKKNRAGGIRLTDFRLYFKATVIKALRYWHKIRNIENWRRREMPEINSHTLSMTKEARMYNGKKISSKCKDRILKCWQNG